MKKVVVNFFYFKLSLVILWLLGFAIFTFNTGKYELDRQSITDAIVVFGPKKQRLYTGTDLMKLGYSNITLIVGGKSSFADYAEFFNERKIIPEQIMLRPGDNYIASIDWFLKEYEFSSFRLVADNDQMPRALKELRAKLPTNIQIIPHPVSRAGKGYLDIFVEYNKYLLTFIASFLGMKNEFSLSYS